MRLVIQRTTGCELHIDGTPYSAIGNGLVILFGTKQGDSDVSCGWLAEKAANLRIFEDDDGKLNRSLLDIKGQAMIVSQFTLYADCRKGRRPSFNEAMEPLEAEQLYHRFIEEVKATGVPVSTGVFGAKMDVKLTNHGPVTIIVDHEA